MIYNVVTTPYKMPGWPDGIPGVEDEAGNTVCICPETHGVASAMLIARALTRHSQELMETTHD